MTEQEVIYTARRELREDFSTGRLWRFRDTVRTAQYDGKIYKDVSPFGTQNLAYECRRIWRDQGWKGNPSCPAAFFHKVFRTPKVPYSAQAHIKAGFFGGWQESFTTGLVPGPLWLYDIKSAYLWAATEPLPTRFEQYRKGDKHFICLYETDGIAAPVPWMFNKRVVLVTSDDLERYPIRGGRILWGLSWQKDWETRELMDVFMRLQKIMPPEAYKLCTQSFWGRWASVGDLWQETYVRGKLQTSSCLKNSTLHMPWATLLVHRVMAKVFEAALYNTVLVMTDAVLRTVPLKVKQKASAGDWVLKDTYDTPVHVRGPGLWTQAPADAHLGHWHKHSGIATDCRARMVRDRVDPTRRSPSHAGDQLGPVAV